MPFSIYTWRSHIQIDTEREHTCRKLSNKRSVSCESIDLNRQQAISSFDYNSPEIFTSQANRLICSNMKTIVLSNVVLPGARHTPNKTKKSKFIEANNKKYVCLCVMLDILPWHQKPLVLFALTTWPKNIQCRSIPKQQQQQQQRIIRSCLSA